MIDNVEAKELVYKFITRNGTQLLDNPPSVREDTKRQLSFGWLFFWQSQKYLDTGEPEWGYLENVPLLVDKFTGSLQFVNFYQTIDEFLEEYRIKNGYPAENEQSDQ